MKWIKIIPLLLTGLKLLMAAPWLVAGAVFGVLGIEIDGFDMDRLMGVSIFFGSIGLGYPFSLVPIKGFAKWIIVALSALPLCFVMLLFHTNDRAFWISGAVALAWIALASADLILSTRPQLAFGSLKIRAQVVGGVVLAGIATLGICAFLLMRGRPYQAPPIAFHGESKDLRQSVVVPTLDTPIPTGKNVIWCGTLQLAWNHLGKDVLHEPPKIQGAEAVVSRLNQGQLREGDLPSDSFLATAGFGKDGVVEKVKAEMERRFHRKVEIEALEPNDILAYAYLEANAAFTVPFFDKQEPLRFTASGGEATEVGAFGIEERHEYAYKTLREQIAVLHCLRSESNPEQLDEFVVDLCRSSSPNQILIACVPPRPTLAEMLDDVKKKVRQFAANRRQTEVLEECAVEFGIRDVLLVPNLNWEIQHRFAELEGSDKKFSNNGFSGYYIFKAIQSIRFKLDRSGAELASEAQVPCKPMATYFVCDRPFLIVAKRRGAERPFFVMWVDNAELLCKP